MKFPLVLLVTIFLVVVVATTYVHVRPALPPTEHFQTNAADPDQETYDKAYAYLSATMGSFNAFTQENQDKYIQQFVASNPSILKTGASPSRDAVSESDRLKKLGAGSMNACPTSAYYDKNGVIHVDPGNMTFRTMDQYQNFMASLVGQKSYKDCPVLQVQSMAGALAGSSDPGVFLTAQPTEYDLQRQALDRSVIDTTMMKGGVVMLGNEGEQTYAETPINKLDDYEYSRVFELEHSRRMEPLAQEAKSDLMSQYRLDWANLPWNSDEKAMEEEAFISGRMEDGMRDPKTGVFFRNMEGADVGPPDEAANAEREAKILSAYIPTDISKHVVDSEMERVAQVVNQAYASDPDWEPVVEKRGEHQYAVTELRPRAKKERWENDTPTVQEAKDQGILTGTSFAPDMKIDGGRSDDPYFDKSGVVDNANDRVWKYQDFNKWTPGLERMFAPTNDTQAWY